MMGRVREPSVQLGPPSNPPAGIRASLTHLIRRLGQSVIGIGALGLLSRTTGDLGAAAGGCGVITQGRFLHRKRRVPRSKFTSHPKPSPDQMGLKYDTRHQQLFSAPGPGTQTQAVMTEVTYQNLSPLGWS